MITSIIPDNAVTSDNGDIKTTSLKVAEAFGKQHRNVTAKIKSLDCSDEFRSANFSAHPYINEQNGETYNLYQMTKDGFMFLVMGFTGKKAAAIKEAYINAFNAMAATLKQHSRKSSTDDRTGLRDAINLLVSKMKLNYPEAYGLVHQRFNVKHIDELDTIQIAEATAYVHRVALDGEWLGKDTRHEPGYMLTSEQARLVEVLMHSAAWVNYRWHQGICNGLASLNPELYSRTFEHINNLHFARRQLDNELAVMRHNLGGGCKRPEELMVDAWQLQ
jgi:Rha family phage regulatory protein